MVGAGRKQEVGIGAREIVDGMKEEHKMTVGEERKFGTRGGL